MALSKLSPNFQFLEVHEPLLVEIAVLAERYTLQDPNTALIKLRQFIELLAKLSATRAAVYPTALSPSLVHYLVALQEAGYLPSEIANLFHSLRKQGNKAVHELESAFDALSFLRKAREVAVWFHRTFGDEPDFIPAPFIPPPTPVDATDELRDELAQLQEEIVKQTSKLSTAKMASYLEADLRQKAQQEAHLAYSRLEEATSQFQELEAKHKQDAAAWAETLAALQAQPTELSPQDAQQLKQKSLAASLKIQLSEADTRKMIDEQLRQAGWEADSQQLTYQHGIRPEKGRQLAIAEWPVAKGRADYLLFIGLTPVGVVEAKRASTDVSASLQQCKRYSCDYNNTDFPTPERWGDYKLPFLFATNGRPYLEQLQTKSGIWFQDVRQPVNLPRPLTGWFSPEGLTHKLQQDIAVSHDKLREESTAYLHLRDYQIEAILAVEAAIEAGQQTCLLAMATGTGKTRTCIGLLYRLIKSGRFHRVLFLVDRSALGRQAYDAFTETKLESNRSFTEIYGTKELKDILPEIATRLHIATVQGMVQRILYPGDDQDVPSIDTYDCIVVDESHRGYNLDREMSDTEMLFRDQDQYISKYRRVLDHFDAVKIGLTATPATHTTQIFGNPVYQYSYREAVIEGHLIDHEPPIKIVTKLAKDGIRWQVGEEVTTYNTATQQQSTAILDDEVNLDIDQFNKEVITESFNKVICERLAYHIDPLDKEAGKTLIFCANDQHADLVVQLFKQACQEQYGTIYDDAIVKITGAADKPDKLLRLYRNETFPSVAVTVDLLTTGIDVPAITHLVFLRRVRSRILYEQMLGRATRQCKEINKETFRIFDAVGLYDAMADVSTMRPVVTNPSISFGQLAGELKQSLDTDDPQIQELLYDQFSAKLNRKTKKLTGTLLEYVETAAGMPLSDLLTQLHTQTPQEFARWLTAHPTLPPLLDEKTSSGKQLYISQHADAFEEEIVGYGDNERPEDYLESFARYIEMHQNEIQALTVVLTRPQELTRAQLKDLMLQLDLAGFREKTLQAAWRDATNQDIAASIIGFIRQQALKQPLLPYSQRVQSALDGILASRAWSPPQRKWLEAIGKQVVLNIVVDKEALDSGQFQQKGGFNRLNTIFDGELESILEQLNGALWQDAI